MIQSLDQCKARLGELDRSLMDPAILSNPIRIKEVTKERAHLVPIVELWSKLSQAREEMADAREMLNDPEMKEMAELEIDSLSEMILKFEDDLRKALIPPDPYEGRDIILEIRAGTGGDEAALFAADLFRMYSRFGSNHRWKMSILDTSRISVGGSSGRSAEGFKEIICQISGGDAYRYLQHESGVHRVQRVPLTETQGRIHTSAATVAILPVAEEVEVNLDERELRIDVMRAGGPGGQSVNTTDSAVRIIHLPTGLTVKCQDEKSQHKNKAKAMRVLAARLLELRQSAADAEEAEARRAQVGSGDRSERIRTYNYPQNRITDHRINLTLYKLDRIVEGDLTDLLSALNANLQEQLASQFTSTEL
ncbi:MAG: peptide chain release factor 1 [Myxococcota bacterium]|nr:peptide chain release factor 1 [Myxococcota bacterium]